MVTLNETTTSSSIYGNSTTSTTVGIKIRSTEHAVITSLVLIIIVIVTFFGNAFVIYAVVMERNLRRKGNILIASLAVTDLLVSVIVMPFGITYEISETWFLGSAMCDFWVAANFICCASSILHLLAISLDRYWAITDIRYMTNRSLKRICFMIAACWIIGMALSLERLLTKNDPLLSPEVTGDCLISENASITSFITLIAFYIPAIAMIAVYVRIYKIIKAIISADIARRKQLCDMETTASSSLESVRERKLTKTLSVVTGTFILCWLPFFVVMPIGVLTDDSFEIHHVLNSVLVWFGYCNSMLNPFIYTVFSEEFRNAFRLRFNSIKGLCCQR